ncbi:MAG: hypothetical protein V4661_09475 [Pseudomonadota bacterium]
MTVAMTVTVAMMPVRLVEVRAHIAANADHTVAGTSHGADKANLLGLLRDAGQRRRQSHSFSPAAAQ